VSDNDPLPGPRLNAVVKEIGYEDGQITRLVFVNEDDGEQWRIEGEMEVVDPYSDGEPIPDGGEPGGADHEGYLAAFEVYRDGRAEWRWRLLARNGRIIADSAEGYSSKMSALNAVDTARSVARDARINVEGGGGEAMPDGGESA